MSILIILSLYPAYLIGSFFIKHDPGPVEPKKEIHRAIWFGILSVVLSVALSLAITFAVTGTVDASTFELSNITAMPYLLAIALFALIEELTKFVPIALYLRAKPYFNEHTDGIIYFATVGLTFGAVENFLYGITFQSGVALVASRLIIALFFHGALTSIVGYFYARAHVRNQDLAYPLLALATVSIVHTAYNFFAYKMSDEPIYIFGAAGLALAANIAMFWLFLLASNNDQKMGLTTERTRVH